MQFVLSANLSVGAERGNGSGSGREIFLGMDHDDNPTLFLRAPSPSIPTRTLLFHRLLPARYSTRPDSTSSSH